MLDSYFGVGADLNILTCLLEKLSHFNTFELFYGLVVAGVYFEDDIKWLVGSLVGRIDWLFRQMSGSSDLNVSF